MNNPRVGYPQTAERTEDTGVAFRRRRRQPARWNPIPRASSRSRAAGTPAVLGYPVSAEASRTAEGTDELLGARQRLDRNADENSYSGHVRDALLQLLRGDRGELDLLDKYHREPGRLGILPVPETVSAQGLRLSKAEEILRSALRFLHDGSPGGPAAESEDKAQGLVLQTQDFPTRFPHIVIRRTDHYDAKTGEHLQSCWSAYRLQNQQSSLQVNRTLDLFALGIDLLKFVL